MEKVFESYDLEVEVEILANLAVPHTPPPGSQIMKHGESGVPSLTQRPMTLTVPYLRYTGMNSLASSILIIELCRDGIEVRYSKKTDEYSRLDSKSKLSLSAGLAGGAQALTSFIILPCYLKKNVHGALWIV